MVVTTRKLQSIRTAIIGLGFIGNVHLDALRRLGVNVGGVLESASERGVETAKKAGLNRSFADIDELAAADW